MSDDQLDLFGASVETHARPAKPARTDAVAWARTDDDGRLGWAPLRTELADLAKNARAHVALFVTEVSAERIAEARTHELSPRRCTDDDPRAQLHLDALAQDLRTGRRAVVLADDPTMAARWVAAALIAGGSTYDQAVAAIGGKSSLGPTQEAKLRELLG